MKKRLFSSILILIFLTSVLSGCEENNDNNLNIDPVANFEYEPINPVQGDTVIFTDLSNDSDGSITSWDWNFGNGSKSKEKNPSKYYNDGGTYTVTLTITDNKGGADTITKKIIVSPNTTESNKENNELKYGVLYLYWNDETYNEKWNEQLSPLFEKAEDALYEVTEGMYNYSFDILGSYKTDEFCWNPARLSWASQEKTTKIDTSTWVQVDYTESPYIDETDEYNRGDESNLGRIPCSTFGSYKVAIDSYQKTIIEEDKEYLIQVESEFYYNDCENCRIYNEDRTEEFQQLFPDENYSFYQTTYLTVDFDDDKNLFKQKFNSTKLNIIKERAAEKLGFNLDDYKDIVLIFGRLGDFLIDESDINHYKRCHLSEAVVAGYSNLIYSENSILKKGFCNCAEYKNTNAEYNGFYLKQGWHIIVHEFLHKLGAVDVYHTDWSIGYESDWQEAAELDPRYNESVMGDDLKPCMLDAYGENGNTARDSLCSEEQMDEVYLDKLNRQKIGLE